ncbi:MAG: phosphatidylglycerophosphatase A [Planctomycetes bacterium]|nr:phosphatidylglycerophosphatase A [Planctomycetota bacterium]
MAVSEPAAGPGRWSLALVIATAGGLGHLRPAPGTWGTLGAALPAWLWLVYAPTAWCQIGLWAAVALAVVGGLWSAPAAIRRFGVLDPSQVVIDEVAGLWLSLAVVPATHLAADPTLTVVLAVVFFRLFDIAKPWPLNWLEHLHGGWGIMADDLAAGLLAGMLTVAVLH